MDQQPDQYSFITDPSHMAVSSGKLNNKSPQQRLILGVVFIVAVLVVAIIVFMFIINLGKANNSDIVTLRAYQTEIDRIADLGLKGSTDLTTRNTIATLRANILSDQGKLSSYMESQGLSVSPEQLASLKDATLDTQLESAKQRSTFDAEAIAILRQLATDYDRDLGKALDDSKSEEEKAIIESARTNLVTIFASN